jgi:protein-S-isoprenylcysteine O-methyltransferase Ste14
MPLTYRDYTYVLLQFVLFGLYLFEPKGWELQLPSALQYVGLGLSGLGAVVVVLAMLQLNRSLSPFPTPKVEGELIESGLYRYVRHPIYSGIILLTVGYALFVGSGYKLLVALALWVLFHLKSSYEEQRLQERYADYSAYQERTGRFWPLWVKG